MATCQQAVLIFGFTFQNNHKTKELQLLACVELCYPQRCTFKVTVTEKNGRRASESFRTYAIITSS